MFSKKPIAWFQSSFFQYLTEYKKKKNKYWKKLDWNREAMGFLENIHNSYGQDNYINLKRWASTNNQLVNYRNHKSFLLQCRTNQVLPLHLNRSINCLQYILLEDNPFKNRCYNFFREFQLKALNLEIAFVHWKVSLLQDKLNACKNFAKENLPHSIFISFEKSQMDFYNSKFKSQKTKQKNKLTKLIHEQYGHSLNFDEKWFKNLTNLVFPENVKTTLALGEKFNLPYDNSNLPLEQIIVDVEFALSFLEDEDTKIEKRNQTINILSNYMYSTKNRNHSKMQRNLLRNGSETRQFLKENSNILITKADKGNVTVALYREDYLNKAKILLSDVNTYKPLNKDPTITIQNKLNKILDNLLKSDCLTKELKKNIKTSNGIFPKMYFLPKIHKEDFPLRPIVSFVGSPTYNLTKYLANLLKFAFEKDDFYTKNSYDLVKELQNIRIPPDYILISLDVVSLFTNIPTDLTKKIVQERWHLIRDQCNMSMETFVMLLDFVFDNSYFNFDGVFYKQIYGLGMGNCLSPVCSDIVMSELQKECTKKLPFHLPFFKRYVDDIITCIPADKLETIQSVFNDFHPKLKFTVECENDGKIPFLDIVLIRTNNNNIITDWYHKPTFSERFLNYQSEHAFKQKHNIITNLKSRALLLSHPQFHDKNLNNIETFLLRNNYPHRLIKKILFSDNPNNNEISNNNKSEEKREKKFLKIPYVRNLSERVASVISNDKVQMAFKNENTLSKYFSNLKEKTPKDLQSGVIYKIPCLDCEGVYVGQTGRYLKTRITEHERSVRPVNFASTSNKTALAEHTFGNLHRFDFSSTEIIGYQPNYKKRLVSEMINIKKQKNSINKKQDTDDLSTSYYNLINMLPKR